MEIIDQLQGVDVYLIDQILKERLTKEKSVLDAGCGHGRNLIQLHRMGFNVQGFDPNVERLEALIEKEPSAKNLVQNCTIESFESDQKFDFIICNAVLHFAQSHEHFNQMFAKLVSLLNTDGILFVRMTTKMGMTLSNNDSGIYHLKDETTRYVISRERITRLCIEHNLTLLDPVKSTLVEDLRSMGTVVFSK